MNLLLLLLILAMVFDHGLSPYSVLIDVIRYAFRCQCVAAQHANLKSWSKPAFSSTFDDRSPTLHRNIKDDRRKGERRNGRGGWL